MNFYLISNMYPTAKYPGYGSFVKNVCDNLTELGVVEKYQSVIRGKSKTKEGKIIKYLKFYFSILFNFWKKYDFIYIHFPNQAVPILLPLLFLKKRRLVVNLHGEDLIYASSGLGNKLGKMMERMCSNYADAIVVPSEYFKKVVEERSIIDSSKIIVSASGGVKAEIFYPNDVVNTDSTLHIGYVGRMEKDKGIVEFLYACKKLSEIGEKYIATAIGYGSYFEWANQYILKNNLTTVKIIRGLPQSQLGNYYRKFDLLIFSSSSRTGESLGLTGIEAMACGTPVIGSDIGGIATYVKSGENGWLTPVHDVNAIVDCILKYNSLSQSDKIKMSEEAIATGKKYYSDIVCDNLKHDLITIL